MRKIAEFIVGLVLFIVALGALRAVIFGDSKDTAAPAATSEIDTSLPLVNQLEQIFTLSGIRGTDLKINVAQGGYDIRFTHDFNVWDDTDFVNRALGSYVAFCQLAYEKTSANGITFYIWGTMIDSRGNENDYNIFTMSMPKETFLSYKWDNIAGVDGKYEQIKSDCTLLDIYASIRNNMDTSKVHVTPP